MKRYNPSEIEPKWQTLWEEQKTYEVTTDLNSQKLYVSGMFPYPSGAGMHTGHAFSYSIADAIARFYRQHGKNVLNPMGWDTFGLPAENYAIKTGTAPAEVTKINIENFKKQFKRMGVSIDWSREISTSDPEYYRWTQWIFTKFFERGLAYQKESMQWWCPVDKTVLANEQVEGGKCWRCGTEVVKKSMNQWFFKITDYADALLDEIEDLDWPQKIKTAQTNWIGKSVGAEVTFKVEDSVDSIEVFTTRPDTLFGASFIVLAPEHAMVRGLATDEFKQSVESYTTEAIKRSEIDRMKDSREKTGVFTGSYAINPATGERIPIWVADYVLAGYGTGAIMAVPAHDQRDFEFAERFKLPVIAVVEPETGIPQKDPEFRSSIVAIVRNPKTNKYLSINWGKQGGHLFIGGGRDENEDIVDTAKREIIEETGFKNIELVRQGGKIHHNYFAHSKNVARRIEAHALLFDLVTDEQTDTALEPDEEGKFSVEWLSGAEIEARIKDELHMTSYELLVQGKRYHGEGIMINSGDYSGMKSSEAREKIVADLAGKGVAIERNNYKMRDWLISRQRYWGAPIPIIHCSDHGAVPVPESQLPVILPDVVDYAPKGDGKSVLAGVESWVNTSCPICDKPARRETDTMDGYACSSWYLLRYTDPKNDQQAWSPKAANYWTPIDYYVGGDHAVAHLLYVRFWTHVFKDMGIVDIAEPIKKLVYHGYINAEDGTKMSKSKGNVIDPLDVIEQGYGADALRTYVLFMGPIELDAPWDSRGIAGIYRFLNRVWVLTQEFLESDETITTNDDAVRRLQHKTVRKVTDDYHRLSFNTAISALMEYTNELYKLKVSGFSNETWREALGTLARLLAPLAPHISAELWTQLGNESQLEKAGWPDWDKQLVETDTKTIIVQVNGKLRAKIIVSTANENEIKEKALNDDNVKKFVIKEPTKIIYVPGRLINIVL